MAANGYIMRNGANTEDIYFGDASVASVYYGNVLVWEKVKKELVQQFLKDQCFEFVLAEDTILSNISFLGQYSDTHARFRILNECGLCVAYCSENGVEHDVTIYGLTGTLKTSIGLGTPTLYAGQKYYININGTNYDGMTGSKYKDMSAPSKTYENVVQINSVYTDAVTRKCYGSAASFSDITQKTPGGYFIWRGPSQVDNMLPSDDGTANPYVYLLNRDMSNVKKVFTETDFQSILYGDDIEKYAFIYYTMGNNPGDEFIMNAGDYWGGGFRIVPGSDTKYFTNNKHNIYKLSGNMVRNHITSMQPITNEPSNPTLGDVYYKSNLSTWGNISERAVVAYGGSGWEIATNVEGEFEKVANYTATNYITKISGTEGEWAKEFNKKSVQDGDKLYFRLNGREIF